MASSPATTQDEEQWLAERRDRVERGHREIGGIADRARATAIAVADAASAASAMRCSKRCTSSSSTNTAPAIGALKAVAKPAPAPAAISTRMSGRLVATYRRRSARCSPHLHARAFASQRQARTDRQQAARELHGQQDRAGGSSPRSTASTCGMPLPGRAARSGAPARRRSARRGAGQHNQDETEEGLAVRPHDRQIAQPVGLLE